MDILTRGERRFFTEGTLEEKPYMEADVLFVEDVESEPDMTAFAKVRALLGQLQEVGHLTEEIDAPDLSDAQRLSFAIPAIEGFTHVERQRFLEMTSSTERLQKGVAVLARILERVQVTQQIHAIIGGNGSPPRESLRKLASENDP
jgi:Lon protease-like protein